MKSLEGTKDVKILLTYFQNVEMQQKNELTWNLNFSSTWLVKSLIYFFFLKFKQYDQITVEREGTMML